MRFVSTRRNAPEAEFQRGGRQRHRAGWRPLYLPTEWPHADLKAFGEASDLAGVGARFIAPFVAGDRLESKLPDITKDAFDFPAPLVPLTRDERLSVLELFHGPTAAFKDFGARFLAATMGRARGPSDPLLQILVATSGDTGGAVAAAFHNRPGIGVSVLFPKGLVSPTQERQLTCWGGNVRSFSVRGTFDDCQRMVKEAFADAQLRARMQLSSANSINLGRLLPQAVYYAATSLAIWRKHGEKASYVVPSGNLGNVMACFWARKVGLPIGDIVLAHDTNRAVPDYFETRRMEAPREHSDDCVGDERRQSEQHGARAEPCSRKLAICAQPLPRIRSAKTTIRARIRKDFDRYGQIWCPHTAVAAEVYDRLPAERRSKGRWDWYRPLIRQNSAKSSSR